VRREKSWRKLHREHPWIRELAMRAEIGILLVHGIGTQNRGETVVNIGEPLYRALKKWIESASLKNRSDRESAGSKVERASDFAGQVDLIESVLNPARAGDPAHVRLRITTGKDSSPVEWIIAESHWANSFPQPDHRTVTLWLMRIVPWICISFLARRIRMAAAAIRTAIAGSPRRWLEAGHLSIQILLSLIALPLVGPLVLLLEACLIALLIAGLVPLKIVRDFIARINAVISSILGDSFIYSSSQMRQQAAISKIRSDLEWFESRWGCKHLVILAHSQGAALSYLSLRGRIPGKVRLLFTFGSGLLKLHQLSAEHLKLWVQIFGLFLPFTGILLLAVVAEWLGLYPYAPRPATAIWANVILVAFFIVITSVAALDEHTDEIKLQTSEFTRHGVKWIDAYASMDPVPNGPLFLSDVSIPESVEVCNGSSAIRDHTSYTKNPDEFLLLIINALGRYSGTELPLAELTPDDAAVQDYARRFRRIRITSRKTDEYLLKAALIALLLAPGAITSMGTRLGEWINSTCHWVGVSSCWGWSPAASGLLAAILGYVLLNMCIEALASVCDYLAVEGIYGRSIGLVFLWPTYSIFSHMVAGVTISLAALLHYEQTFWLFEAIHRLLPDETRPDSVRLWQGFLIGLATALVLAMLDMRRVMSVFKEVESRPTDHDR
jgi:hypothetical protein